MNESETWRDGGIRPSITFRNICFRSQEREITEEYYYDHYNATTAGRYLDSQERPIIDEFLDGYTPRLFLDIACGSGRFSLPAMDRGICVVAGDYDPVATKTLSSRLLRSRNGGKRMHILQTDAENLPFRDRVFDCILSIQTVGYLDAQHFISECSRLLQDGGWLLFNEANRHSYKGPIYRKLGSSGLFYRYSYSEICSMLADSGFQIKKVTGMNWLPIRRNSNNRWIPLAAKIERGLKLSSFPSISPWIFYVAQKGGNEPGPGSGGGD